ncbi:transmembrane protein fend [Aedes albopictus]|uniref:Secreted protein n=1 Tax=Aedes albopictus TaxID=7160 RepID=A0ABM1ZEU3_AEDAL
MGPIKFNLSVASAATAAGLMVCLLTTATLVTVGHAAIATAADGSDAGQATPNAAIVNRKVTADGGDGSNSGHRDDEELPAMSKPTAAVVVAEEREPSASAAESCREACSKKHSTKESLCSQRRNCSTCQRKCILESLSPSTRDPAHRLTLVLLQMIRNESLVTADVAWVNAADSRSSANRSQQQQQNQQQPQQCLVTWEVSGGGLMGNLLTESSTVQLSLWPETNYRVQVTCRSKVS